MSQIMIIGAGRIGTAVAKILRCIGDHKLTLVDASEEAIEAAILATAHMGHGVTGLVGSSRVELEAHIQAIKPELIICAGPFFVSIDASQLAALHGCHYLDFTEDVLVTKGIQRWAPTEGFTFVPQTGLAPGLINYMGLELFEQLGEPESLSLRVGALPRISTGPAHYAITWSTEGLINEYLQPAVRKRNHILQEVPSLDDLETLIVDGVTYEAFTTSGGVGSIESYDAIPNVEYKTIRFPGHQDFIQKLFSRLQPLDLETGVSAAKSAFYTTRNDQVVLAAWAVDIDGRSASTSVTFYPHAQLGLTAIELTTAGTGVAVAELILAGELPPGPLMPHQIPMRLLRQTKAYDIIFSTAL
jgi:saccharopine dehydrogenase-like NADP-dependent oxidoreductase